MSGQHRSPPAVSFLYPYRRQICRRRDQRHSPVAGECDWITLSPKDAFIGPQAAPVLNRADELKVVFDGVNAPQDYSQINITHRFLQPCDHESDNADYYARNAGVIRSAIEYIKQHPHWRLSLQIHKVLEIR